MFVHTAHLKENEEYQSTKQASQQRVLVQTASCFTRTVQIPTSLMFAHAGLCTRAILGSVVQGVTR